eukprot:CAMPEP_0173168740 /NCGR_PEP_ID=MMETSP1141-20130122/317_1 /TAXON_ID=483371 /ORGANISM="non described non described, Strain CCMP2298" /LENGTH=133 /DNA_ID=CAMNT_0014090491 /DNA_START=277 /DNA_END=675 /DNA_ORIENTATION=-
MTSSKYTTLMLSDTSYMHGSMPQHSPGLRTSPGSFHSIEFSLMWMYVEAWRRSLMYSASPQQGHTASSGQQAGAAQQTKHPSIVLPGATLLTISKVFLSILDIMRRPLLIRATRLSTTTCSGLTGSAMLQRMG